MDALPRGCRQLEAIRKSDRWNVQGDEQKLAELRQLIAETEARLRGKISEVEIEESLAPLRQQEATLVESLGLPEVDTAVLARSFWQQFPDTASDTLVSATEQYLNYLVNRYSFLDFKGLGIIERIPRRVGLLQMFVAPKGRPFLPEGDSWQRPFSEVWQSHEPLPVLSLLGEQDGLVILGDTGSGKTTLLKYTALALASGRLQAVDGINGRLPLILPLSIYADALQKERLSIQAFIQQYFDTLTVDLPLGQMFREILRLGTGLLLFDGLDEVRDLQMRYFVVDQISHFFAFQKQAGNKLLLTSRLMGYREARLVQDGIEEVVLAELDDASIERFIEQWTTAVFNPKEPAPPPDLLPVIKKNEALRSLAGNPLLLTIMLLMNQQHISLPDRRVELYAHYLQTLLKFWNLARTPQQHTAQTVLSNTNSLQLLAPLALWMEEDNPGIGSVQVQDALRQLVAICQLRKIEPAEEEARRFLDDMRRYTGVVTDLGNGRIAFLHRAFQQYLAAWAVAQRGQSTLEPLHNYLEQHIQNVGWWELLRLALGIIGIIQQREEAASRLLQTLADAEIAQNGAGSAFIGQVLGDIAPIGLTSDVYSTLLSRLHRDLKTTQLDAQWRIAIGRSLGRLREGLSTTQTLNLCMVPGGDFVLGEDHYKQTVRHLTDPYWLSQHPITNYQFNQFVEDGGYHEERYWSQAEKVGRWRPGETMDWERRGWRKRPFEYGYPFNLPNHPAVGLTWYEATAFCHWLEEKWRQKDLIPAKWRIRLPSEAEWEKAARGGLQIPKAPVVADPVNMLPVTDSFFEALVENEAVQRRYPWGDAVPTNRANFAGASGLFDDGPHAAGCFPNGTSPYGCFAMAGNVWEWTQSLHRPYPYEPKDGRESTSVRLFHTVVLRGGAFWSGAEQIGAAVRIGRSPNSRSDSYGFRICVAVS